MSTKKEKLAVGVDKQGVVMTIRRADDSETSLHMSAIDAYSFGRALIDAAVDFKVREKERELGKGELGK